VSEPSFGLEPAHVRTLFKVSRSSDDIPWVEWPLCVQLWAQLYLQLDSLTSEAASSCAGAQL
jgi:hypothetical protein